MYQTLFSKYFAITKKFEAVVMLSNSSNGIRFVKRVFWFDDVDAEDAEATENRLRGNRIPRHDHNLQKSQAVPYRKCEYIVGICNVSCG
jgi:hypothetical protein